MTIIPQKLLGDSRVTLKTLPEKSFHLCITSPPYWGLRSYLPKGHPLKHLEIGCEPTIDLYITHLLEVFSEVWRVLRDDGTLVLNMGDAYSSGDRATFQSSDNKGQDVQNGQPRPKTQEGLKPKDLLMMPARVAMAIQASGWYLRSMIPWIKRNSMPESVTDRPASATEYLFLFSKSERYFWDRHAIMMPVSANTNARVRQATLQQQMGDSKQEAYKKDHAHGLVGKKTRDRTPAEILKSMAAGVGRKAKMPGPNSRMFKDRDVQHEGKIKNNASFTESVVSLVSSRNRRNTDWFMESWQGLMLSEEGEPVSLVVNPKGTTIQHFASYPPKMVEPFVKACTSERGCCADCGTPWKRETGQQSTGVPASGNKEKRWGQNHTTVRTEGQGEVERHSSIPWEYQNYATLGWRPDCECRGKLTRGKIVIPARISKDDAAVWGADANGQYLGLSTKNHKAHGIQDASDIKARIIRNAIEDREVDGWIYKSDIPLDQHPVKPCSVLDPFGGTSTTAEVCTALGRHSTVGELNPEYFEAARQRDSQSALALL